MINAYFLNPRHSRTQLLGPYLQDLPVPHVMSPRTDTNVQCEVDQSRRGKHCTPIVYRSRNIQEGGSLDLLVWRRAELVRNALMVTGFAVLLDTGKGCVHLAHECRMLDITGLLVEQRVSFDCQSYWKGVVDVNAHLEYTR
jgi:hypothetical protein